MLPRIPPSWSEKLGLGSAAADSAAALADSTAVPAAVAAETWDLSPYVGKLVRLDGRLILTDSDPRGTYGVMSREGGLVVVRLPDGAVPPDMLERSFAVGDRMHATGLLLQSSEAHPAPAGIPYQVQTRSVDDLAGHWWPPVPLSLNTGLAAASFVWLLGWLLGWASGRRRRKEGGRQHFREVFEDAAEPMLLLDTGLRILEANAAASKLIGQPSRKLHLSYLDEWVKADEAHGRAALREELERGLPVSFEALLPRETGETVNLEVKLSPVEMQEKPRVFTVLHDLTPIKEQSNLFQTFHNRLLEEMPIEVVVMSPQGEYMNVSPGEGLDAQTCAWLIGKTDVEYCQQMGLHPEIALRRRAYRKQAMSSREVLSFEEELTNSAGETRHFLRVYNPVTNKQGEVFAVVAYGIETTELKRYQAEAAVARVEAEKFTRLRESFMDNLNHEFRTPLTGILGAVQILTQEVAGPEREFIQIIEQNGQRLMDTLNSMLDLAGLQTPKMEVNLTLLNLVDEVNSAIRALSPLVEEKGLFLRASAAEKEVLARLDRNHLHRILENLVGNAVKFTEAGGILVEVSRDAESVYIRVIDSGVGIQNAFLPQLFEAFNQESQGDDRSYEGVGIGLTITKRLIDLLRGSISVESEKGEGSIFTIAFPASFPPSGTHPGMPARVVVVDGSTELQRLVEMMLDPYFQVAGASDLHAAVDLVRRTRPEVMLLDLNQVAGQPAAAILDGFRRLPGLEMLEFIALHAKKPAGGYAALAEAGFAGALAKPLDRTTLLNVLSDLFAEIAEHAREAKRSASASYQAT